MNRTIVYPGSLPQDTDILSPQKNTMIALGFLARAAFGITTVIDGLAVIPTGPASMQVIVGPGSIIAQKTVDATDYGSIVADNANSLVKIGVNLGSTTMSALTAPGVGGQSQNWLLEAQFLEADGGSTVLPYYNAGDPTSPYSGPANAGTAQNTTRNQTVSLQWKGGTAATTGTQNTPSPDAGWVGVAIVTVANGQSTIVAGNITPYAGAPYVPTKLPSQRTKLLANLNIYCSPSGSDSNSGLSAASPFLTLQKAWTTIVTNYDLGGFVVTVNLAAGTYSTGVAANSKALGGTSGAGSVIFLGDVASPASYIVSTASGNAFYAQGGAEYTVAGVKIVAAGALGTAISSSVGGVIAFHHVNLGAATLSHLTATNGGFLQASDDYTISGGSAFHATSEGSGNLTLSDVTVTLTGTPAFSTAFATASSGGLLSASAYLQTGGATGSRYSVTLNGVINTGGGGANYLPGNAAGSTGTGGQYA